LTPATTLTGVVTGLVRIWLVNRIYETHLIGHSDIWNVSDWLIA
jgi:hypothetical protein